jgi:hypothetical protein
MEATPDRKRERTKNVLISVGIIGGILAWAWFDPGGYLLSDSNSPDSAGVSSSAAGVVGETLTNRAGVSVGVSSVSYRVEPPGISVIGEPLGEYATVTFFVENGSNETLGFSTSRLSATIDGSTYDPSGLVSLEGAYLGFSEQINPGLSLDMVVYFDIPPGSTLDTFEYDSRGLGNDSLRFNLN